MIQPLVLRHDGVVGVYQISPNDDPEGGRIQRNRHRPISAIYHNRCGLSQQPRGIAANKATKHGKGHHGMREREREREKGVIERGWRTRAKKGADRCSPEITACSNICITGDDESRPRVARRNLCRGVIFRNERET